MYNKFESHQIRTSWGTPRLISCHGAANFTEWSQSVSLCWCGGLHLDAYLPRPELLNAEGQMF